MLGGLGLPIMPVMRDLISPLSLTVAATIHGGMPILSAEDGS